MAILTNGIYSEAIGGLGNTVTYQLKGKTVVRLKGKITKPRSIKQLANGLQLKVITLFLKSLNPFLKMGFAAEANKMDMYPQNLAVSYNKKNAVMGQYPDFEVDYPKLLLSMGDLPALNSPSVTMMSNGLKFTWDPQIWMGWPRCNDQVMLLAYLPNANYLNGNENAFYTLCGESRIMGSDFLRMPESLMTQRMEVYIAVVSDDRSGASMSQYLGRLN